MVVMLLLKGNINVKNHIHNNDDDDNITYFFLPSWLLLLVSLHALVILSGTVISSSAIDIG